MSHRLPTVPSHLDRGASAAGLRRLRPLIRSWLDRDLASSRALRPTRAYVDFILACGFARLCEADDAEHLQADAGAALVAERKPVHDQLLACFRFRVGAALSGLPHGDLFPPELLPEIPPRAPVLVLRERFEVESLLAHSRVLDPFHLIDPFGQYSRSPQLRTWVNELSRLREPERRAARLRELLVTGERLRWSERAHLWQCALGFAATVGPNMVAALLFQLPAALGPVAQSANEHASAGAVRLFPLALSLAAELPEPEFFPPLAGATLGMLRTVPSDTERIEALASVGWALWKWGRAFHERDAIAQFLYDARDLWPALDGVLVSDASRIDDALSGSLRAVLAHAMLQALAGRSDFLVEVLPATTALLAASEYGGRAVGWERFGARVRFTTECATALVFEAGKEGAAAAERAIEELLSRLLPVRDEFTTSNLYSRFHFQVAEAIILAFLAVGEKEPSGHSVEPPVRTDRL